MKPLHRFSAVAFSLVALVSVVALAAPARAQSDSPSDPYPAVVTAEDVYVRSGAGQNYYPFGRVDRGDVVTVVEELYGWARVRPEGPAFREFFGLVQAENVELGPNDRTATTLGVTNVFAPNITRDAAPSASWLPLVKVPVGRTLDVLGEVEENGRTFYRIELPENADGWIAQRLLRRATPEEVRAYREQASRDAREAPSERGTPRDEPPATEDTPPAEIRPATPPAAIDPADDGQDPASTPPPAAPAEETADVPNEAPPLGGAAATPPTAAPETPAESPAEPDAAAELRREFEALEASYKRVKVEPIETAEYDPLRSRYLDLAARAKAEGEETVAAYAKARATMLQVRADVRDRMLDLRQVRREAEATEETARRVRRSIEAAGPYDAVGRLTVSTVFSGGDLPRLLRLVDPATGRTLAYVDPTGREADLAERLGQFVGVAGETTFDPSLRLTLIEPRRVEVLTAANATPDAAVVGEDDDAGRR